ncbi:MAG: hypothetical protein OXE85_03890 [Roseovarius sp.]|nr:hypothetical protein [Roseovarius sp.]MCY4316734.1 hypothetical protein [Roseovarius sp.]
MDDLRAAQGRLLAVADKGEFDLARESRRERLPVREGEPADQTSRFVPQIQVPPLVVPDATAFTFDRL